MAVPHVTGSNRTFEYLILGGGPTGLGALWRLIQLGVDPERVLLLEAAREPGGLSRSVTDEQGFTWDLGGHVVFSHYDAYDTLFQEVMKDAYTLNDRESWVWCRGVWTPYPFQNNLRYLPEADAERCLVELERAQERGDALTAPDFGAFIERAFGTGISDLFMRPYNFKVWAHPPEMLNTTWIGERVAVVDAARARENLEAGRDDFGWGPNNRFKFPMWGTGSFYSRLAAAIEAKGGLIETGARVVALDPEGKTVELASGERIGFGSMLSTIPLDLLCSRVVEGVPAEIADAAAGLKHSSGHFVGVGIKRPCPSTRSWMYFADDETPFYRVTYLSNYSPKMTPDPEAYYSLLCEVSESGHKPVDAEQLAEQVLAGLESCGLLREGEREDIVSVWQHRVEYSYPVPSLERDAILERVLPWLEARRIASRGRFGLWKYEVANTDHSVMQGMEWASREVLGEAEQTMGVRYEIAADGRGRAVSERPAVAGSGEKRPRSQG